MSDEQFPPLVPLDSSNAIWDDGEWISWYEINEHLAEDDPASPSIDERSAHAPHETCADKQERLNELIKRAQELVECGERSQVDFGEMGELYAEMRYGLKRHRKFAQGSDGKIGNEFVEVKTITPWKTKKRVSVRRSGHFGKLVVVKIDERFMFDSRIIPRSRLAKGSGGRMARVSWASMPRLNEPKSEG